MYIERNFGLSSVLRFSGCHLIWTTCRGAIVAALHEFTALKAFLPHSLQLQLSLKPVSSSGKVFVQIQEYNGTASKGQVIDIDNNGSKVKNIALSTLLEGVNTSIVKQVLFTVQDEDEAELDDIRLVVVKS